MIFVWLLVCNIILTDYTLPFWLVDVAYAAQLAGWFGIAAWGLYRGKFQPHLLVVWTVVWIISQPADITVSVECTRLLGLIGLYSLNMDADRLRRWADWALPVVLVIVPVFSRANPNDISMLVWVTLVLSNRRGWWAVGAAGMMIALHSEAALIALLVALAVERWGWRAMAPAIPAMAIIGLWRGVDSSAGERVRYWVYALQHFTVWGNGLPFTCSSSGYAHNIIMDVLYVSGLPGLGLLGVAGWWLWRNRANFGPWSGFIAGFLVYSLVDYPHWSVPGAVLMIILSKYRKERIDYGITLGRWIRVRFLEPAGVSFGRSHRQGVAPVSDSHRPG